MLVVFLAAPYAPCPYLSRALSGSLYRTLPGFQTRDIRLACAQCQVCVLERRKTRVPVLRKALY